MGLWGCVPVILTLPLAPPPPEPLKMSPTAQNNGFRSKVPILMFLRIEFSTRLKKSLLELNNFKIFKKIRGRLLKNGLWFEMKRSNCSARWHVSLYKHSYSYLQAYQFKYMFYLKIVHNNLKMSKLDFAYFVSLR